MKLKCRLIAAVLTALAFGKAVGEQSPSTATGESSSAWGQSGKLCPPVCLIFCQYGNVPDENGCPTCKCRTSPCPLLRCAVSCPIGFETDANGCKTCKCRCPPLPKCAYCPYGSYPATPSGCPRCPICKPKPPCPILNCTYSCPMDYLTDPNGCKTCSCNCPVIDCTRCPSPQITQIITDPVTGCSKGCKCQCLPHPACPICQYGSQFPIDDICPGCPICNPAPTCPPDICKVIECPTDRIKIVVDSNGCKQCTCDIVCPPYGPAPSGGYGCP